MKKGGDDDNQRRHLVLNKLEMPVRLLFCWPVIVPVCLLLTIVLTSCCSHQRHEVASSAKHSSTTPGVVMVKPRLHSPSHIFMQHVVFQGRLNVSTSQPADIELDGVMLGRAPLETRVTNGVHALVARFIGIGVQMHDQVTVDNNGVSATTVTEFAYGQVKIASDPPGARVKQGDTILGQTPLVLPVVFCGDVSYELDLPGCRTALISGTVKPGQTTRLKAKLQKYESK